MWREHVLIRTNISLTCAMISALAFTIAVERRSTAPSLLQMT
jgi:hypothetical protein